MRDRTLKLRSAFQRLRLNNPALKVRSFVPFRRLPALAVAAALLFEGVSPAWALARDLAAWRGRAPEAALPAAAPAAPAPPAPAPAAPAAARPEASPAGPAFAIPGARDLNALTTLPADRLEPSAPLAPLAPPPAQVLDVRGYYQSADVKMTLYQNGDEVWGEWNWIRGYSNSGLPKRLKGRLSGSVLSADWEAMDYAASTDHGLMALTFAADGSGTTAISLTGSWGSTDYATYSTFAASKAAAGVKLKVLPESRTLAPGATQAFKTYVSNTANTGVTWTADGGSITPEGLYTAPAAPGVYTLIATSAADPSVWTPVSVVVPVANGIADYSGIYGESSYLRLYFYQNGDALTGDWPNYNRQLSGTLNGNVFTGRWQNNANPADYGQFAFTFATTSTGYTVTGTWGTGASSTGNAIGTLARSQNVLYLSVSPHLATIAPGEALKLRALVSGHAWQGVRWTASGGTVDATGTFTCATPGNYTVTATSAADPSKSASADVHVAGVPAEDVSGTWPLGLGTTYFHQAGTVLYGVLPNNGRVIRSTLTGTAHAGLWYYINPRTDGGRAIQGTFTGNSYSGTYVQGATYTDTNKIKVAGANVYIPSLPVALRPGETLYLRASVSGVANRAVTWSASAGSIDANGVFTAPATAGVVSITATSAADPTKSCVRLVSVGTGAAVDPAPPVSGYFEGNERNWCCQGLYPSKLSLFQDGLLVWGTFFSSARFNSTNTVKGILNGRYLQATFRVGTAVTYPYYFGLTFAADGSSYTGGSGSNGGVTNNYEWLGSRNAATVSLGTDAYFVPAVPGGSVKLCAFTGGPGDRSLTWAATSGSVAPDGTFTAPSAEGATTVTATSVLDPAKTLSFTVEVQDGQLPPEASGAFDGLGTSVSLPGPLKLYQDGWLLNGDWVSSGTTYPGAWTFSGQLGNRVLTGTMDQLGKTPMQVSIGFGPGYGTYQGTIGPSGIGWKGTRQANPITVKITPAAPQLPYRYIQQFLGQVGGTRAKGILWSASAGTVNGLGVYTPPNLAGTHTVTATSVADPTRAATATVTMPAARVEVTPGYGTTRPGGTVNLQAEVLGNANPAVTWAIQEAGGGSISASGVYTAPATPGTFHVTATSAAVLSAAGTAVIEVKPAAPVSVTVAPYATQLNKNGTATFTATVEGTSTNTVTWTASAGTIDTNGNYTAPNAFGTYTVTATSTLDPSAYGIATIVVSAQSGTDKAFTYDENGNMTSDGERTFEWDAENRLVAVNILPTGQRSEFTYDGVGHRVEIIEKDNGVVSSDYKYQWEALEIAEQRNATGETAQRRFFTQGFVDTDGTYLYYLRDHLGSIRELTDSLQAVRAQYDYDPSGRRIKNGGDKDNLFGFAGYYWHGASKLYLAFCREYDPNLGRWISVDPFGEEGGTNLYRFNRNNQINLVDPFGMDTWIWWVSRPLTMEGKQSCLNVFRHSAIVIRTGPGYKTNYIIQSGPNGPNGTGKNIADFTSGLANGNFNNLIGVGWLPRDITAEELQHIRDTWNAKQKDYNALSCNCNSFNEWLWNELGLNRRFPPNLDWRHPH